MHAQKCARAPRTLTSACARTHSCTMLLLLLLPDLQTPRKLGVVGVRRLHLTLLAAALLSSSLGQQQRVLAFRVITVIGREESRGRLLTMLHLEPSAAPCAPGPRRGAPIRLSGQAGGAHRQEEACMPLL